MNEVHNTNRINILKDVKTAVNTLFFAPSEQNKVEAKASIEALINFVDAIEMPKPKASKPVAKKAKPSKAAPKEQAVQPKAEEMMELFKQFLALQGMADSVEEPKAQPKPKASPRKKSTTSRKPKVSRRPSRNEKLEAQAQKLSLKAAEDRAAKNAPKEVVVCDNKPTKASPFGTRRLVTEGEAKPKASNGNKVSKAEFIRQQQALLAEQEAMAAMTAEQLDLFNDDLPF